MTVPELRFCSWLRLALWQLFVGGVAAEPGSAATRWYVNRLRDLLHATGATLWYVVEMMIFPSTSVPSWTLKRRLWDIWDENKCCGAAIIRGCGLGLTGRHLSEIDN